MLVPVHAFDDNVFEGTHGAQILLQSSSTDVRYQDLQKWQSVTITDNDCLALRRPRNSRVLCSNEETLEQKSCRVLCNSGYAMNSSKENATAFCDKRTGAWTQVLDCEVCAPGFFNSSGSCQRCSSLVCPVGQYRGKCGSSQDAVCRVCSNPKPAHAQFTTGGIPFDANNCSWACNDGYYRDLASSSSSSVVNLSTRMVVCKKLVSTCVFDPHDDPIDTDGDG